MTLQLLEPKIRRTRLFVADNETLVEEIPVGRAATSMIRLRDPSIRALMPAQRKMVLLVSADAGLDTVLGSMVSTATLAGQRVSDSAVAYCRAMQDRPAVMFVDLDLPALEGWEVAERFLKDVNGPPLILLTGHPQQFDMEVAIRTGMVLDKSNPPRQWLEKIDRTLAEPKADQEHNRAGQRLLLRLLHPFDWTAPGIPAYRHWGINE
jgi:CheY-like chemotaxis protein